MRLVSLTAAALALAVAVAAAPSIVFAHPKLVNAMPAANATVGKANAISLTFSEDLVGPLSGVDLVMTGMPGMADHKPMPIKGITAKANGKILSVALPRPLPTGSYMLSWHAVAADQHRVEGSYTFTVR